MLEGYHKEYGLNSAVVVPVNLYGPGDNFNPASSHVIPALIRKCEEAREREKNQITCWGTGSATRQFLYVDDAVNAFLLMGNHSKAIGDVINFGTAEDYSIKHTAERIVELVDSDSEIIL